MKVPADYRETLFDEEWYRNGGPPFEGDAYEHFAAIGWRAGRAPHPLFDPVYYAAQVPELEHGEIDPLRHYAETGAAAGLDPHILFDTSYYTEQYADLLAGENPLVHYLTVGAPAGYDPNPFFSSRHYLDHSPDVSAIGMNPLVHYAVFGGNESQRRPHPLFDAEMYAERRHLRKPANALVDFLRRLRAAQHAPRVAVDPPDVSAIILNLNKSVLTLQCVVDLVDGTASLACEIVVVDNGSTPHEFAALAAGLPPFVKLIRLRTNRFFGEGNNIGAEASAGRLLLFLNNDAFVGRTTVETLMRVLEQHPDAGAVGPKFVYVDGRLQECGAMVSSCGSVTQRGKFLDDQPGRFARTEPVDYVSAACVLTPRALFDEIGGFDLTWDPAYYEDVDLCLRLALLGKRTYYAADAVVTHIENATSSDASHGLRLNTVVQINREKFVSRWGDYLEDRSVQTAAHVRLPAPHTEPPATSQTAVLFTPYPLIPGGGERYLLSIGEALSRRYRTFLVTPERYSRNRLRTLGAELDLDLSRIGLRSLEEIASFASCDLFVAMGNETLPQQSALGRRRVYVCQFPFPMHANHVANAWSRLDEYDDVVVYSPFAARNFTRRAEAVANRIPPVTVLPPSSPVYEDAGEGLRAPGRILNVGRFNPGGHCKRQDTLIDAFRELIALTGRTDLELHLVGTVSADPVSREFYLRAHRSAQGLPVYFHLNAPPDTLRELYATSSFYWHATGYGQSDVLMPERMEHFGISVVEAMSSKTIPLVYAAGGPAEIVEHGVTGYHWRTIAELVAQNAALFGQSPAECEAMRERGRAAVSTYDTVSFVRRLEAFLGLPPHAAAAGRNGAAAVGVEIA